MRIGLAFLLLPVLPAFSQQQAFLDVEYQVVLTIDEAQSELQDLDQVPDNTLISIAYPAHMVELKISMREANAFTVDTAIFEHVDEKWTRLKNDESGGFSGALGALQTFEWKGNGVGLSVALKASSVRDQAWNAIAVPLVAGTRHRRGGYAV